MIASLPTSCICTTCLAIVAAVNVLNVINAFDKNILRSSGGDIRYWEDPSEGCETWNLPKGGMGEYGERRKWEKGEDGGKRTKKERGKRGGKEERGR